MCKKHATPQNNQSHLTVNCVKREQNMHIATPWLKHGLAVIAITEGTKIN